jgi:hypothetical protein
MHAFTLKYTIIQPHVLLVQRELAKEAERGRLDAFFANRPSIEQLQAGLSTQNILEDTMSVSNVIVCLFFSICVFL